MVRLIVGCGYLGLPVARKWLAAGDQVFAISRSRQRQQILEKEGLQVITADITEADSLKNLSDSLPPIDTILFAVGFDRSKYGDIRTVYVDGLANFLDSISNEFGQFIYISSTGVFGPTDSDIDGWVSEDSSTNPIRPGGVACLEAEQMLQQRIGDRLTVLRLAGIYGSDRIPNLGAIKQQQWDKLNPIGYLNLIHVVDAAETVCRVAEANVRGETFLVADGAAVERKVYYEYLANLAGVEIDWGEVQRSLESKAEDRAGRRRVVNKRVNSNKLRETIPIELAFPSYREGVAALLSESAER